VRVEIEPGVRLYVDVDGAALVPDPDGPAMRERPTVLLLHGGPGGDHAIYKVSGFASLRDVAQVVYYDHRSQGRSDPRPAEEWTLDVWADDVVRLCDALGIERPIVIGSSFGGFVAQRYLARHPEHPAKVVLACTQPCMDTEAMADAFTRFGTPEAGATARRFFAGDQSVLGDFLTRCLPLYARQPVSDPYGMGRSVMNMELQEAWMKGEGTTMDLEPGLAAARCPVLVVGGELDPVCPIEMSERIAAALPPELVTLVRVPGASHIDVAGDAAIEVIRAFVTA
jgi:pimeloyl-ACP methyl ester carboxylesterase